jgi:hypothetical protein
MISILFGRKFGIGLVLDVGAEDRLLPLEFARLVAGFHPVEDGVLLVLNIIN